MNTSMSGTTRERLIKVSHDLFYKQGFHSVGLDQILDEVGVTKTTFYNHFESKEALVLETLRWHDRWWRDTFTGALRRRAGDSPRDRLLAVFDALDEFLNSDEYNGCIFINVAVQFPLPHDPAHRAAAEHKRAIEAIVSELAAFAGAKDPGAFAEEFCMVIDGAYVSRQVKRDATAINAGRRLGRLLVEKYLGAPA